MLLTIDIGNTRVNYGVFKGSRIISTWNHPTSEKIKIRKYPVNAAVISSVVPQASKRIKKLLKVPVTEISPKLNLGLQIKYKTPQKVGADRLANAVGAMVLYGTPALVLDFGTATTIDAISKKGDYLGGVILPGLEMTRKVLHSSTALLPLVNIKKPKKVLGQDTDAAIQSGLYHGFCGMVENIVKNLKKELRFSKKTVIIATGGNAGLFKRELGLIVDPELTLKGLRIIYERQSNT